MDFKQFLVENWKLISILLLILISIILTILKKTKIFSIPEGVIPTIIDLINCAESEYGSGHGEVKKECVVQRVKQFYPSLQDEAIEKIIEIILSTPEKKGVKR